MVKLEGYYITAEGERSNISYELGFNDYMDMSEYWSGDTRLKELHIVFSGNSVKANEDDEMD